MIASLLCACALLAATAGAPSHLPHRVPLARGQAAEPGEENPPGASAFPLSAAALCARGEHDLEDGARGSLLHARTLFETAVRHYPDTACGHAGLARAQVAIYLRRIEQDDALAGKSIEAARRALEIEPGSATAHAALAGALLADLRLEEASTAAETALRSDPASWAALSAAAATRMALGEIREGMNAARQALDLRPDLPSVHQALGNLQLLAGDEPAAIESYRSALALSAGFLPAALQLAAAFEELGDYREAGDIFRRLLNDHPEESSRIHLYMGHSLMKRRSWNAALGALEKASFKSRRGLSQGTVRYLQGVCFEQLNRLDEAHAAFREVIEHWPDATSGPASAERVIFRAYQGLGRIHLVRRERERAVTALEEGAARPGATLDLSLQLARIYQEYKLPDKAAALLERAAARPLREGEAGRHLEVYVEWARISKQAGDHPSLTRMAASLESHEKGLVKLRDYVYDLDAARAFSIAGRGDRALGALSRAIEQGYSQLAWIATDPELQEMRDAEGYQTLTRTQRADPSPTN